MVNMVKYFLVLISILFMFGCSSFPFGMAQSQSRDKIYKIWTPNVRDVFIEMARESGCFERLIVNGQSCFGVTMKYNPSKQTWEIECEPLSQIEAPECYR
jgi:hypothetical protein